MVTPELAMGCKVGPGDGSGVGRAVLGSGVGRSVGTGLGLRPATITDTRPLPGEPTARRTPPPPLLRVPSFRGKGPSDATL